MSTDYLTICLEHELSAKGLPSFLWHQTNINFPINKLLA